MDRGSSVGVATCYGVNGSGANPDGGEVFYSRPDRNWGPHLGSSTIVTGPFPGLKKQPERAHHHPHPI